MRLQQKTNSWGCVAVCDTTSMVAASSSLRHSKALAQGCLSLGLVLWHRSQLVALFLGTLAHKGQTSHLDVSRGAPCRFCSKVLPLHPPYQRKGRGAALLQEQADFPPSHGPGSISLSLCSSPARSLSLLQKRQMLFTVLKLFPHSLPVTPET